MPRWLFSLALAAACGGGSSGKGAGDGTTPAGGGGAQPAEARPAPDAPLTHDECIRMVDHLLDVALTEQKATLPPDKAPTEEDKATARERMRGDIRDQCVGKPIRPQFDCVMAGKTRAEIEPCMPPQEGAAP